MSPFLTRARRWRARSSPERRIFMTTDPIKKKEVASLEAPAPVDFHC